MAEHIGAAPPAARRSVQLRWEWILVCALFASLVLGRVLSPYFLTGDNISDILAGISELGLIALPMTLVIIAAEIDLSVASVLGLSSALLGVLWHAGLPMPLAIGLACIAGACAGWLNGWIVVRLGLPSLAVTIGTMALYRGLAYVLLGSRAVANFPGAYTDFGINDIGASFVPQPFVVLFVAAVAFVLLLHATTFGRAVYAIGTNAVAARFSGLDVARTKLRLFVLSGLLSAVAGVIYTLRFTSARGDNGQGLELSVIAAVLFGGVSIFGGRGSLGGVLLSVLLVGVLRNALTLYDISSETLTIVTGLLLLSSVLVPNLMARLHALRDRRALAAAPGQRPQES